MKKTEYNNVSEIETLFDQGWVPFEKKLIGYGDSGYPAYYIIDNKSGVMYIEKYDSIKEEYIVYSYPKDEHPTEWVLDVGGVSKVKLD